MRGAPAILIAAGIVCLPACALLAGIDTPKERPDAGDAGAVDGAGSDSDGPRTDGGPDEAS
jgi:hypothetical protein